MAKTPGSRQLTLIGLLLTTIAFSFACLRLDEGAEPPREPEGLTYDSRFLTVEGGVEYRRGDRGRWMSARADDLLQPGDWVKTAVDGSAVIRLQDGSTYALRRDTLVHLASLLERAPSDAVPFDGGFVWIGMDNRPPVPEATAGPQLVSPVGEQEIDFASQKVLRLAWERVPEAPRYALHVSRSASFDANVIEDSDRRKPSAKIGIRGEGTFYWRVAAYDPAGSQGAWSETRSFRVTSRG